MKPARLPRRFLDAILIAGAALAAADAPAATITVTGTGDTIAVDGVVTLREAITSINNGANVNADVVPVGAYGTNDQIVFNIPGTGLQTISPNSNRPNITNPVIIDGYTQPGSSPNTLAVGDNAVIKIDLSGVNNPGITGLSIRTSNATIRGLAIHLCGAPLDIRGGSGNKVIGNFLGTDPTGSTVDWPSIAYVLYLEDSSNNTIGGTVPADRNLISGGRLGGGLFINTNSSTSTGNVIQGNYIGTNAAGTGALPNYNGVSVGVNSSNNTIGGTAAGAGNLISGNMFSGVYLSPFSSASNVVQGNLIGTDATGSAPLGNGSVLNGGAGVVVAGMSNLIGATAPGAGNVIAFNIGPPVGAPQGGHGQGVIVVGGVTGNTIRGNSIYSNSGLGIDLNDNGVTPNDACDTDFGSNNLQNFPVLTSAVVAGASTRVLGTLNSTASTTYQLDFYSSAACDPSGYGEGQTYLGSAPVTTNASCNGSFDVTLPVAAAPQSLLTATVTDPGGSTSEFSACIPLAALFYAITPCRVVDTRGPAGPYGAPSLAAGANRTFVFGGQCGIPATALAVAMNVVAVLPTDGPGFLTLFPGGTSQPLAATMNYNLGKIRANNAIIPLGSLADLAVHCGQGTGTVDMVIDVNGYFQ
jgi:hypothetical protein